MLEEFKESLVSELGNKTAFTLPVLGGVPVAESVVVTWIIMALLVVLCLLLFSIGPDDYISYSLNRMLDTGVGVAMSLLINGLLPRERLDAWQEKLGALRNRSEAGR